MWDHALAVVRSSPELVLLAVTVAVVAGALTTSLYLESQANDATRRAAIIAKEIERLRHERDRLRKDS